MISFEDFTKVKIVVGQILSVEKIADSKKLLKLSVNVGEEKPRQIFAGIAKYFSSGESLVGKKCMFVVNMEPKIVAGLESQGMLLALSTDDSVPDAGEGKFSLIIPESDMPTGTRAM